MKFINNLGNKIDKDGVVSYMNIPKISIIVPIYNAERYINRSIDSLINQKLKEIEIILVNDGSIDNSLEICKKYEELDSRVIVINKENGGVSSARNAGLKIARGEFIGFIDPDDWIENDMYYNMYNSIKNNYSEVVMCNYCIEEKNKIENKLLPINKTILNKLDIKQYLIPRMIDKEELGNDEELIMGSVCRLLIKRDILEKYNITFNENIHFMEDLIFCIDLFSHSNSIIIDHNIYYHYIKNEASAVTAYKKNLRYQTDNVIKNITNILNKSDIYKYSEKRLNNKYINCAISCIVNELHHSSPKTIIEQITIINDICKDRKLKEILSNIDMRYNSLSKKLVLISIKNNYSLYLYFYYKIILKILH